VGVGKNRPTLGQFVHVRCLDLRMPLQGPYPIIEVINGNEEDVGLPGMEAGHTQG